MARTVRIENRIRFFMQAIRGKSYFSCVGVSNSLAEHQAKEQRMKIPLK